MASICNNGRRTGSERGRTIFDFADRLGLPVPTSCNRQGTCHECIVEIKHGAESLSPRTVAEDFLRGNFRLACQAIVDNPEQDVEFALLERRPRILTAAATSACELDPTVSRAGDKVLYDSDPLTNIAATFTAWR